MKVYSAIAAVAAQMAKDGISKSRTNAQQGFKFRGIDETLNALAPVLSEHGLVVLPRMLSRELTERQTRNGGVLFSVVVDAEFDFVAVEDGSKHTVKTYGEAMDSGDKATNKAMSIAYKYAAFLAFCIPVEVVTVPEPIGYQDWLTDMQALAATVPDLQVFRDSYKSSPKKHRDYIEKTNKAALDAMVEVAKANEAALLAGAEK